KKFHHYLLRTYIYLFTPSAMGSGKGQYSTARERLRGPLIGRPLAYARGTVTDYSHRRAIIGSTFAARRAGIQQATSATESNSAPIKANVSGALALTPKSSVVIRRVKPKAATSPAPTPLSASLIPCPTTSLNTSPICAPSAIRTPISCVRCATV